MIAHGHGIGVCKNGGILRDNPLHGLQGFGVVCSPAQASLYFGRLRQFQHMSESEPYPIGPSTLIAHKNDDDSGDGNKARPLGRALPKAGKAADNHEPA